MMQPNSLNPYIMEKILNLTLSRNLQNLAVNITRRALMTTPVRLEEALDNLKRNNYYEKYANKIAKLQQTSPEEFLSRVDHLEKKKQPEKQSERTTDGKFAQLLNPKKPIENAATPTEKVLGNIMKLDLIADKTPDEIKDIWYKYHSDKDCICAVISTADYEALQDKLQEFPTFVFPLPREQGYEFMMSQVLGNTVHFTPLLYYQVHKENAPECLNMTHYTELKESKGIVLMRGEYDKNVIDLKEAQCLANQLQLYYVRPSEEKTKIMETFTKKPDEFKHMDLIKQIESLSL